uniref:Uncharacterized protein n=1 Tax=Timema tahoe TaxID=61484 RepID=A0A7R9INT2_9NEOP|nr:unnamed protein product [Timema tahoe]
MCKKLKVLMEQSDGIESLKIENVLLGLKTDSMFSDFATKCLQALWLPISNADSERYFSRTLSLKITHHQCCNHCRRRWGFKKRKGTAKDKMPIGKEDKKKSSRRRRIHQVIIIITFTQMKVPTKDRSQRFPLAQGRGKGHVTWRVSDDGRARCS